MQRSITCVYCGNFTTRNSSTACPGCCKKVEKITGAHYGCVSCGWSGNQPLEGEAPAYRRLCSRCRHPVIDITEALAYERARQAGVEISQLEFQGKEAEIQLVILTDGKLGVRFTEVLVGQIGINRDRLVSVDDNPHAVKREIATVPSWGAAERLALECGRVCNWRWQNLPDLQYRRGVLPTKPFPLLYEEVEFGNVGRTSWVRLQTARLSVWSRTEPSHLTRYFGILTHEKILRQEEVAGYREATTLLL